NLVDTGIARRESEDVLDVTAAPLVDGLVVVADHADARAQLMERPDDGLLYGIHVLVLVDNHIPDALRQSLAKRRVVCQRFDCSFQDRGIVEIASLVEQLAVRVEPTENRTAVEMGFVPFGFAQNSERR